MKATILDSASIIFHFYSLGLNLKAGESILGDLKDKTWEDIVCFHHSLKLLNYFH